MEEERYIGGFFSAIQLALGAFEVGAGVYATTERLFVVGPLSAGGVMRGRTPSLDKIAPGLESVLFAPTTLTMEQHGDIIKEILDHNGFQVEKSTILRLEIKKPPGIFRMGYLDIVDTSGNSRKVKIGKNKQYEMLLQLLRTFKPEALKIL